MKHNKACSIIQAKNVIRWLPCMAMTLLLMACLFLLFPGHASAVTMDEITTKMNAYTNWLTSKGYSTSGACKVFWNANKSMADLKNALDEMNFDYGTTATKCPRNDSLAEEYRHSRPNTCHSNEFQGAYQCNGFTCYFWYYLYGSNREYNSVQNTSNLYLSYSEAGGLQRGDLVTYKGHYGIVDYIEGDGKLVAFHANGLTSQYPCGIIHGHWVLNSGACLTTGTLSSLGRPGYNTFNIRRFKDLTNGSVTAPTSASLRANKTNVGVGGTVEFTYSADQPCEFYLHVEKDGPEIDCVQTSGGTISYTFTAAGEYALWIGAGNEAGSCGSNPVFVTVSPAPTAASLSANKTNIGIGGIVDFTYSADQPCEFYLHVEKDGPEIDCVQTTGGTISYTFTAAGEYVLWIGAGNEAGSCGSNPVFVNVIPDPDFILPTDLTAIGEEAFMGIDAEVVLVPSGCASIGARAFADCPNLKYVIVDDLSAISIAEDALDGTDAQIIER